MLARLLDVGKCSSGEQQKRTDDGSNDRVQLYNEADACCGLLIWECAHSLTASVHLCADDASDGGRGADYHETDP